jgi:hypothetical protein
MDVKVLYYAGLAYAYLGQWNEAINLLQRSLDGGNDPALVSSALAAALEGRHVDALARGEAGSVEDLRRARDLEARSRCGFS